VLLCASGCCKAVNQFVLRQIITKRSVDQDRDVMGWKNKTWLMKKYGNREDIVDGIIETKTRPADQ
jgi:hypothetical protein